MSRRGAIQNGYLSNKLGVIDSIITYKPFYIFTSTSIPMTIYTPAVFKGMTTIWITIQNMCAFWTQCHHFWTRFEKFTSTLITNNTFIFFHAMLPQIPFCWSELNIIVSLQKNQHELMKLQEFYPNNHYLTKRRIFIGCFSEMAGGYTQQPLFLKGLNIILINLMGTQFRKGRKVIVNILAEKWLKMYIDNNVYIWYIHYIIAGWTYIWGRGGGGWCC